MHGMLYWSVSVANVVLASSVSVVTSFWEHVMEVVEVCNTAGVIEGDGSYSHPATLAADSLIHY